MAGTEAPNPIELQKYLGGSDYPASKEALVDRARQQDAPPEVVEAVDRLPADEFDSPAAVSKSLGQMN